MRCRCSRWSRAARSSYSAALALERGWQVQLRPLDGPLAELVESMLFSGEARTLRELRIVEVGGDQTLTRFADVDPERRFAEAELMELFGRIGP